MRQTYKLNLKLLTPIQIRPSIMSLRTPYRETRRKLLIAFDVGTTFSGVSYSILDPGQVPQIKGVTRFPAQKHVSASSKIPTIIYYDKNGTVRAVGAEAVTDAIVEKAEDEGWTKAEWFKLHLRPKSLSTNTIMSNIPPLPNGKTVIQIFADYLRYLFDCTCTYIKDTHFNGDTLLATLRHRIDYVLSHPNGWEGLQQYQMREAAVLAGLIPSTPEGLSRITFVTEGEASLHFAINNGFASTKMNHGEGVIIVDAGGGTIDISAYARQSRSYVEISAAQCHLSGSVFVTMEAGKFLSNFLLGSKFSDDLEIIKKSFDESTKLTFGDTEETQFIAFGSHRDNDPRFNVRHGRLKLTWQEVASFFEPSVTCIVNSVKEQQDFARQRLSHVILVGGFASSDYLYNRLQALLEPVGLRIIRPENHVSKAVADGAISFYLDHFVQSRIAKVTYGIFGGVPYDPNDAEHVERQDDAYFMYSGQKYVGNRFFVILPKDRRVSEKEEFREPFMRQFKSKPEFSSVSVSFWSYGGSISPPKWRDVDARMYSEVCTVEVDLSHLTKKTEDIKKRGPKGKYYQLDYEVALLFGLTELKAQLIWKEKGVEKRSDAKIIYDGGSEYTEGKGP